MLCRPGAQRAMRVCRRQAMRSTGASEARRCPWAGTDPLLLRYHDQEWGVPVHDDRRLFEFLILEGAQAGLSWITILRKRVNYRRAFAGFDPSKVAAFGARELRQLLKNPGIVRNQLKLRSAIDNARAFRTIQQERGSFDDFVWQFVGGTPLRNRWRRPAQVPAKTREAEALSRELARRGFRFVGPTICYAFMQAVGMVNDHLVDCYRHREIGA